jgi:hypothetical protein
MNIGAPRTHEPDERSGDAHVHAEFGPHMQSPVHPSIFPVSLQSPYDIAW